MKDVILLFLILLFGCTNSGNRTSISNSIVSESRDSLQFIQIKTDTLFESNQIISILKLGKDYTKRYLIELNHRDTVLITTSKLAIQENALAAINGGFFNMDNGGSVTYLEVNDSVVNKKKQTNLEVLNGAIIINKDSSIRIEKDKGGDFYKRSSNEKYVLVTGPILLIDGNKTQLSDKKFNLNRHPRTLFALTDNHILLITVDGRSKDAEGMSMLEAQDYLLSLGCVDAINFDGGGSTTMWIKEKGVVNYPSDKTGERAVSNILTIKNRYD